MPWRSWCYVVDDPSGARVALDPPSFLGVLRIRHLMCDVSPKDACQVGIALLRRFGTIGVAHVTGPPDHLAAVRKGLPDWMIADSEEELLAKLPLVVDFLPPPPPVRPRTAGQVAWKKADAWIQAIVSGKPTETPLLEEDPKALLGDPLVVAAGIALDNFVALHIRRTVLDHAVPQPV
jgi:hypothetical protein